MVAANNVQARSNGVDDRGQPLVTTGGGPLPLPMPTQPATLTATRVATKANRTFFIGVPLSFTPCDSHFVPRCTVGRPAEPNGSPAPRQCGTSKGTVSLGTQLRGVRSKTCQRAAGWCGFNSPVFSAATAGRRGAAPVTENAGSRGGRRHMILGGILQSMGALKGNRVACHSHPFRSASIRSV